MTGAFDQHGPRVAPSGDPLAVRHQLLRRLASLGDGVSFVLVVAPVGHGKTTLARQWSGASGLPTAWLTVTRAHRDPAVLARDLASALLALAPTHGLLSSLITEPDAYPPDTAAEQLAGAIEAIGRPLLLVLDDLHEARSAASLGLVAQLAGLLPAGTRILAAADRRPRLPGLGIQVEGRSVRLTARDLLLNPEEVASLLRDYGVVAPGAAAEEVVRRTEGWAVGVKLAASTIAGAPDPVAAARTVSGDHDVFADYVRTHVLAGLSVDTVRFLLRTSVLPRLSGELCDSALDAVGSAAWLSELGALGLPLVPMDDRGEWFRYSRLFGQMLAAELRRREGGEDVRILARASAWFEANRLPEEALECAVEIRDEQLVSRLLTTYGQALNGEGRTGFLRSCLDTLSDQTLDRDASLATMAVWIWALTGDAARARHALRIAERGSFAGPLPDGSVSLESAVSRARAALAPDGLSVMLRDAERAVELEPPGTEWHTASALLLGCARRLTGATREAARSFELAARYGRRKEYPGASGALAQQALLAADQEDWETAQVCVAEAAELVRIAGLERYGPTLVVHLAAARVALNLNDIVTARAQLRRALELYEDPSPLAFPWLAAQAAIALGRLSLTLGDVDAARDRLAEARRHLAVLPDAGLLTAWAEGLADDVHRARNLGDLPDTSLLTRAELRVLALLPTHLSLAEIGDELVVSRNTVKAQVAAIYRKLDAANRSDAVRRAHEAGLLEIPEMRPPS